jgi:hypothetical protein
VVDQHPAGGLCRGGQRLEPVGEAVLERVVGARVEEPLPDLRLRVPADRVIFSRNSSYVYYGLAADRDEMRRFG